MEAPEPRRVSVIVPTHNRPLLLREALASIRALEGADLAFEILVCDNASAGENQAAAADFGAIYNPVPKRGAACARNAGLLAATGEFIAFLDDDDVWLPEHIRPHIALLDERPDLDGAIGRFICTDPALRPTGPAWPADFPEGRDALLRKMLSGYYPQIGATVTRRRVIDVIGLFDEALYGDQDWDWHLRLARKAALGFVPAACIGFRQRSGGTFDSLKLLRIKYARRVFLRHALKERRIWNSPLEIWKAHHGAMREHYDYFSTAALERAREGDTQGVWRALYGAFKALPASAIKDALRATPLREAAIFLMKPNYISRQKL